VQDMPHGTIPLLYTFHFYLFGLIAIVSALLFVTRKSPVAAALWLVNTMFSLAALYVMLDAQFIGAIQVLVYAGAIMVVFLFVIMLLNLGHGVIGDCRRRRPRNSRADLRPHAVVDTDEFDVAAGLYCSADRADRCHRADRRTVVQRVPARIRGDERAAPGGDRRRRGPWQAAR
jgi:hypothetical protein